MKNLTDRHLLGHERLNPVIQRVVVDEDGNILLDGQSLCQRDARDLALALTAAITASQFRNQDNDYLQRWGTGRIGDITKALRKTF